MKKLLYYLLIAGFLDISGAWASEQNSKSLIGQRISIYGGVQLYQADGEFRSTKSGRPETTVDLDDLGLDEDAVTPVFGALYNISEKWALRFDYFGYHEDGKNTAEFDFNFDDETVVIGAKLDSSIDLDVYVLNLAYNFYSSDRGRFGLGVGVHLADFDLEVSSTITVSGVGEVQQSENLDYVAPLPNVYAAGAYLLTDNFLLRYGGGWMSLSYGDYDGDLIFANVFLEYWPYANAGVGIGYRYEKVEIDYDPGGKKEKYDVTLPGPIVYMTVGF